MQKWLGIIPLVHFSFKALIVRVLCTRTMSALSPIFARGVGGAHTTRKNGMLPMVERSSADSVGRCLENSGFFHDQSGGNRETISSIP
jgi:hypothetical protein